MVKSMKGQDRFGPLEEGFPGDMDKRITIGPLLDELDAAEKRTLRLKKWELKLYHLQLSRLH